MEIKELGHLLLHVRDVTQSSRFCHEVLGWRKDLPVPAEREGAHFAAFSSRSGRAHHELLLIEVAPNASAQPDGPWLGLYHLGLKIGDCDDDLRAAVTTLEANGVPILGSSDHTVAHSLYVSDPAGNEIELYIDVADIDWRSDPSLLSAQVRAPFACNGRPRVLDLQHSVGSWRLDTHPCHSTAQSATAPFSRTNLDCASKCNRLPVCVLRDAAACFTVRPTRNLGGWALMKDLYVSGESGRPTERRAAPCANASPSASSSMASKPRRLRLIAISAGAGVLLAACSSSATSQATKPLATASATAQPTAPAPKGSAIKIGLIVSETGSAASSSSQAATVAPAWARYVNEQLGGIAGHPVQVIVADDAGDPAPAQAAEKKLVGSDGVVAIVVASETVPAWDADALSKGIPIVSGTANSTDWYTKPGMFVTATDVLSGLSDQLAVAKQFGKATKFADLYCAESAACGQANPPLQAAATKAGVAFTSLAVRANQTSYTAECLKLQQEKVDYAQLNFSSATAASFVQDCQQQGYNPTWGSSGQAIGKDLLSVRNLTLFGPAYAFPSVAQSPAAATFRSAMQRFAKNSNWAEGTGSFTWLGLEAIHTALKTVGPAVTAKDVMTALYTLKGQTLDGLAPDPLQFAPGKAVAFGAQPCSFVIGIKNGKTVAPSGLTPICPPH